MLTIKQLTKKYGKVTAVQDLNLEIGAGQVAVMLGPNGAGKSTTIKCIAGLLRFQGEITIAGTYNKSQEAKRAFSYVPETPALYPSLTVKEHVDFIAKAYELDDTYIQRAEQIFERLDLADKKDKLGKDLSKGMQQKVSIACGLITVPKVILFDEPFIGLDPKAIRELKLMIEELKAQGSTILISTHIIDTIEELWDRIVIIAKGETIVNYDREMLEASGKSVEQLFFDSTSEEAITMDSVVGVEE